MWAIAILALTWVVFLLLLWLILAVEPVVIPLWFFIPGFILTMLFGVGLIAAKRWTAIWQLTFHRTVRLPPWMWIAAMTTILAIVLTTIINPLSVESVFWIGVFSVAACYGFLIVTYKHWIDRRGEWPSWIAVALVGTFVMVAGIGILLPTNSFLTIVFFAALLLFAFHVWFILPLTLYDSFCKDVPPDLTNPPDVTVLIPAYNEEGVVGDCIEAVLASDYGEQRLHIVVIDDGSTDGTYAEASAYRDRGVTVFNRVNGGKHAALNFGLECTESEVVVTVDADSRPEPGAITTMVAELEADPSLGALSAVVRAQNVETFIARLQRIEYVVSNTNRRAYSVFDAVPVVPGCLGVYRREALEDVWRFDPDTITEDFDVTVKLLKNGWAVRHGSGRVETIVPNRWTDLWRQRLRWYQGGLETLRKHRDVLVSPRYEYLHALSLPIRSVSHLLGPAMSFIIIIAVLWWLLTSPSMYLIALIVLFFVMTCLITLYSIVLEDESIRQLVYAPLLFVGYKHFIDATVGIGSARAFGKNKKW